jgi:hypothetical protein
MVLLNALAYSMAILITSVFVTVSHFHPSPIFGDIVLSLLGEASCLAVKY